MENYIKVIKKVGRSKTTIFKCGEYYLCNLGNFIWSIALRVETSKYLDVYFDGHVKWVKHVQYVTR